MAENKAFDEEKILTLLAEGSQYAFTQIFDHYRPGVYGVAMKFLHNSVLAEEVVQEVFLKVWQRREGIQHVRNFSGYLFVIARNLVFDYLKRLSEEAANKRAFVPSYTSENKSEDILIEKEYDAMLARVVELLPPQQKQIFKMARWEHLRHEEIAGRLDISPLTVKRHMAEALKTIREKLGKHLPMALVTLIGKVIDVIS